MTEKNKNLFSEEEKKAIKKICKNTEDMINIYKILYSNPLKIMVIYILLQKDNDLNKMDVYKIIKDSGEKIAYKNLVALLDQMQRVGLVRYKKGKRYNQTFIDLNEETLKKIMEEIPNKLKRNSSFFL